MKKALALSSLAFMLPLVAGAAVVGNLTDVGNFIINFINNILVPILFAIAFLTFLWGAFQTFIVGSSAGADVKDSGKNLMMWGLIGFFVMVSVWGLVNILTGTFQFSNNQGPTGVPRTPPVSGV